jgi:hypothetical protein
MTEHETERLIAELRWHYEQLVVALCVAIPVALACVAASHFMDGRL